MKTILALCGLTLILGGVWLYRAARLPDQYGVFVGAPKADAAVLIAKPKDYLHKTVAVHGIIREQCTTMGCYFFFHEGDKTLRVDIAEVAMTAPRKNGRQVRVEGQMVPYGDGYELSASAVEFE